MNIRSQIPPKKLENHLKAPLTLRCASDWLNIFKENYVIVQLVVSHSLCQFQPSGSLINRVFGLIFHLYLDFFIDHIFPIQISKKYSKCSNALIAVWRGSRHTWQTLPALTMLSVLWSLKPSYALATWAGCIWSHFFGKPWKTQRQNYKLFYYKTV